ncbi:MAG: GMC family oxidoreductase [Pseudomonadota bacterium]
MVAAPLSADMVPDESDVLIIGAGAAGCVYAAVLAQAGKSVTVLEGGPGWEDGDLVSSGIWSRRLRWGGPPTLSAGEHPAGVGFNSGWGFGGSALHHYGTWPRMLPSDFTMASDHGKGLDWPFDYGELQPYYERVQAFVGISGDASAEPWRPPSDAPYPLPPLEIFNQARLIAKGFDAMGMPAAPSPMAILSEPYGDGDRAPCVYDGWCDAGCPIGSLANPLVTYMPIAKQHGAIFTAGAMVTRLHTNQAGTRATGADYIDDAGARRSVKAKLVILAASTVHNPTILLNSVSDANPKGLGNANDLVGRYFMTHSIAPVYGFFDDEDAENYLGVTGAQMINLTHQPKTSAGDGAFGSLQWLIGPVVKPNDLLGVAMSRADLFGKELEAFMARATRHMGVMFGFGEDLPQKGNRIELSDLEGPDGTRLPRVVHAFDNDGLGLAAFAEKLGLEVLAAAGANDPWAAPRASAHLIGGTVMGKERETSVTDAFGRLHDVENLFIAGPGLFPTSGSSNPNFTNHAVSLRAAEHIVSDWSGHTL